MARHNKRSWEARLRATADKQMMEFVQSLDIDWRLYPYDIQGSIAHARMLASKGLISRSDLKAIEKGLLQIQQDIESGRFRFDPSLEDIHMAIESALVKRIGQAGLKLHTGRSRNDQVATDLRLWVKDRIVFIQEKVAKLQRALVGLASRYVNDIMPAYTHLQRAQPVSIASYLLSLVEPLERDYIRLGNCLKLTDCSPLGCGAIAGSTLALDRSMTAKQLGFGSICSNSIDAVTDRDFAVEFIFDCSMIGLHLSRLATDWIIFCSTEFGFVRIGDAFCTSSSMMPQKRNPDALELIRAKTASIYGHLLAMMTVLRALPSGYNRDLQEDKVHVFACADIVEACLDMACATVGASQFVLDRIAAQLDQGFLDATALAEYLVTKKVPFRQAHHAVGQLVRICEDEGIRLCDLPLDRFRQVCQLIDSDVYKFLGPENVARSYQTYGAAGPRQASRELAYWRRRLARR